MTTIILIRHAHSEANEKGILAGRAPGVMLSKKGEKQAQELIQRLGNLHAKSIRISPLERCLSTLQPWLQKQELSRKLVSIDSDLSEVDYGDWTGKKLSRLAIKKEWRIVQNSPSKMIFPGGEALLAVQERATNALHRSIKEARGGVAVMVSHGDVIKSIIASTLDLDLDKFQKIVIDPASITVIDYNKKNFRLLHLNDSSTTFDFLSSKPRTSRLLVGGGAGRS